MDDKNVAELAVTMLSDGFSVIPVAGNKRPQIPWAEYQKRRMTVEESRDLSWPGIGLVCGKVSGNLECIDFDHPEALAAYTESAPAELQDLIDTLGLTQTTVRGPTHLLYRVDGEVGNKR